MPTSTPIDVTDPAAFEALVERALRAVRFKGTLRPILLAFFEPRRPPDGPASERLAGLSPSALHRQFVGWFGAGFRAVRRVFQLEHAADFVVEGRMTLEAIAEQIGYGSGSALSRAFKRRFGCPPSAFERPAPRQSVASMLADEPNSAENAIWGQSIGI